MSEEFGGFDVGADTQSDNEQGNEGPSEAAVARVRENLGNARKAAGQKAKSQRTNRQLALMLSFIFKYVEDESLVSFVYQEMTQDHIHVISLFALFLPYLKEKMDIAPYKPLYNDVWDNLETRIWSVDNVIQFYKELLEEFPGLKKIEHKKYLGMVKRGFAIKSLPVDKKMTDKDLEKKLYI